MSTARPGDKARFIATQERLKEKGRCDSCGNFSTLRICDNDEVIFCESCNGSRSCPNCRSSKVTAWGQNFCEMVNGKWVTVPQATNS